MKKFIQKLFLLLLLVVITSISVVLPLNYILIDTTHSYTYMMLHELYAYPDNIDILFSGSSHTYRSYNPRLADDLLSKNTFNIGSSSQHLDTTYYLLKEAIKNNNISTVYLDTYYEIAHYTKSGISTSQYIISDYMKWSPNKLAFLWDIDGINAIADSFMYFKHRSLSLADIKNPLLLLPKTLKEKRNFEIGNYQYLKKDEEEYYGKGFVYGYHDIIADKVETQNELTQIDVLAPMSDYSYKYLNKITALCKENNIRLVLVSAPMSTQMLSQVENYQYYIDFLTAFAIENQIEYYNFNLCRSRYLSLTLSDFHDKDHLNGKGANAYTISFCNIMNMLDDKVVTKDEIFYKTYAEKIAETS